MYVKKVGLVRGSLVVHYLTASHGQLFGAIIYRTLMLPSYCKNLYVLLNTCTLSFVFTFSNESAQVIGAKSDRKVLGNKSRKQIVLFAVKELVFTPRMSGGQQKEAAKAVSTTVSTTKTEKEQSPQQIVEGFRKLRDEQQLIASKISELEAEKNEHKLV